MSNGIGRLGALPGIIALLAASGIGVAMPVGAVIDIDTPQPRRVRDRMGFEHDAPPERPRRVVNYIHDTPPLTKRQKRRAKGKR